MNKISIKNHIIAISILYHFFIIGCACDFDMPAPSIDISNNESSIVLFHFGGEMAQFPNGGGLLSPPSLTQYQFENYMDKASKDDHVKEIVIHFSATSIGWARATEIGDTIKRVSKKKPITCHLEAADNRTYWMAARVCESLVIAPVGGIDLVGLSLEAVFLKDLLDSLGVYADMMAVGKYKSAAENLMRNEMSPDARAAAESLLNDLHDHFIDGIANGRKISKKQVISLLENGPYTGKTAKSSNLVDDTMTLSALLKSISLKLGKDTKVVDNYGKKPAKPLGLSELFELINPDEDNKEKSSASKIALIPAIGAISSGTKSNEIFGSMDAIYDISLVEKLQDAEKDNSVKAVVLRIDSPGGSALASDNIWEAVKSLAEKKPVIASMGDVAASGGYYIASATTEIFASKNTITGSIGVVGGKVVFGEALGKIGIHTEVIKKGSRSNLFSPFHPFSQNERGALFNMMKETYSIFIDRVVEGRKLDRNNVLANAEGRVWTGNQALTAGLIDNIGTLHDAIERARKLAQLPGGHVEIFPKPKNFIELLTEQLAVDDVRLQAAMKFAAGRNAIALMSLLTSEQVLTFSPLLFDIR